MFDSCKLELMQVPDPYKPDNNDWVWITLLRAQLPPGLTSGLTESAMYKWIVAHATGKHGYQWWGQWNLDSNSVNKRSDTAYTLGTSAPQEKKLWRYSVADEELTFVELSTVVGDGQPFGEVKDEVAVAATLWNAKMSRRGIEPRDASGTGRGEIKLGSSILRHNKALYWKYL